MSPQKKNKKSTGNSTASSSKKLGSKSRAMHNDCGTDRPRNSFLKDNGVLLKNRKNKNVELKVRYNTYIEIESNKYASKAQRAAVARACGIDATNVSICGCKNSCDASCQNRQLYIECTPGECPTLRRGKNYCENTVIQRKDFPRIDVCLTSHCGHGLRLMESIKEGRAIIEYTGQVISEEQCTERRNKLKDNEDFYFASICPGYVLDAKPMGNRARFANHCCRPNCEMQKWIVAGEPRLVLVALSDLSKGTDLTYNYNCHGDGLEVQIKRQKCLCGASNCAGTIGGRVTLTEEDKWTQRAKNMISSEKFHSMTAYKRLIESSTNKGSILYSSLIDRVNGVKFWIREKYDPLFSFQCFGKECAYKLQELEFAEETLKSYPGGSLRCDEYHKLSLMCKTVNKVGKKLQLYLTRSQQHEDTNRESMKVIENDVVFSDDVEWSKLMLLLKEVAAVLPISCTASMYICRALDLYEATSQWAKDIYMHTCHPDPVGEWVAPKMSSWSAISKIAKFYNKTVTPFAFMLEKCLDHRLSIYIKRAQLLLESGKEYKKRNSIVLRNKEKGYPLLADIPFHTIFLGVDTDLPTAFDKLTEDVEEGDDDYTLHCVCRLPETEGESMTLVQCEECSGWFHPLCINRRELDDSCAGIKNKKVHKGEFTCPFCLHLKNRVTTLANPASEEWFDNFIFAKVKLKYSLFSMYTQAPQSNVEALKPNQPLPNATMSKDSSDEHMEDSESIQRARYRSSVSPWIGSEVLSFIAAGEALELKRASPVLLMKLVSTYEKHWIEAVDNFLCQTELVLTGIDSTLGDESTYIPHRVVSSAALRAEAMAIAQAQFLYSCIRLINVAPQLRMIKLRMLIWVLSANTLLRRMGAVDEHIFSNHFATCVSSLPLYIMNNQRSQSEHLISLDELVLCEAYGRSIIEAAIAHSSDRQTDWYGDSYGSLGFLSWKVLSILNVIIIKCFSAFKNARFYVPTQGVSVLEQILRSLYDLSCVVEMRQVFAVARILSISKWMERIMFSIQHNVGTDSVQHITRNQLEMDCADIPSVEISGNKAKNYFCWCRGVEFGNMICCDMCDDWFHSACMGLHSKVNLKKMDSFICIYCSESKGLSYAFEWSSKIKM